MNGSSLSKQQHTWCVVAGVGRNPHHDVRSPRADVGRCPQTGGVTSSDTPTAPARGGIGVVQGTALYIASVLGTGLLVLPGLAAAVAGPASIVAVVAVILLSVPLAGT